MHRLTRDGRDAARRARVLAILLGILVVLLLVTLITSVWMPVWTEDREARHMRAVASDFGNIKATIDNLVIQGQTNFIVSTPLTLGTEGVPIVGTDSSGSFSINYFRGDVPDFTCNIRNQTGVINVTATGGMKYSSNNRDFVNQDLAYENGAILLLQGTGEVVKVGPQFTIEKLGPVARVSFVLITVSGVETSMEGVGTVLIRTQLITYTSAQHSFASPEWLNITITTEFPTAWFRYFNNALVNTGFAAGVDFVETIVGNKVTLDIKDVKFFDLGYGLVEAGLEA
jgi:type II secretory pathway pseudopilin PulG